MNAPAPAVILYLHSSDDLYGADMILLQIVRRLDRSLFTPIVVLPDDMRHIGLLSRELEAEGIEWVHLPIAIVRRRYFTPVGLIKLLGKLVRGTFAIHGLARRRQARLIHGFTLAVIGAPLAAFFLRLPLILHVHEIIERPALLRRLLHAFGVRMADRVLCVSEATRQNLLSDESSAWARIEVVHNGIPQPDFSNTNRLELRSQLGMRSDLPLVGMIGRVSPWKGQEVFLRAAAQLFEVNPNCQFIAIGGVFDQEHQHFDRLVELHAALKLGQAFTVSGFMKNARDMLPAFDIFVLPSTSPEPFGTVVLEAMSAGLPVIATNHGGACEMVVHGETGLLVKPGDPSELASAIETLLESPALRSRMGQAGQGRMQERFGVSQFIARIQTIYSSVLTLSCVK